MHASLSVSDDFELKTQEILKKNNLSTQAFLDFCDEAIQAVHSNWNLRWGVAYRVTGAWLTFHLKDRDDNIQKICDSFSRLELPDHLVAENEDGVHERWDELATLVEQTKNNGHTTKI